MGFGFSDIASPRSSLRFVTSAYDQAILGSQTAGFLFPSLSGGTGFLDLGFPSPSRPILSPKKLTVFNATSTGLWALQLGQMSIGTSSIIINSNITLALNSPYNLLPNLSSVIQLYQMGAGVGAPYTNKTLGGLSALKIPCAPLSFSLDLSINGDLFTIPPLHLLIMDASGECFFAFAARSNNTAPPFGTGYTLGYSFLYSYYAFFDYRNNTLTLGTPA